MKNINSINDDTDVLNPFVRITNGKLASDSRNWLNWARRFWTGIINSSPDWSCAYMHIHFLQVFILSSNPRRLVLTLWLYFGLGLVWLGVSIAYVTLIGIDGVTVFERFLSFGWTGGLARWTHTGELLRALLSVTLFLHDLVQMVVIVSYGLMCYMLRCYLKALKEKLLLHTIEPLNWMRVSCFFISHFC